MPQSQGIKMPGLEVTQAVILEEEKNKTPSMGDPISMIITEDKKLPGGSVARQFEFETKCL